MNKDKLKVSFEIDRYKVIGMLSRNCENAEEYNEIIGILKARVSLCVMRMVTRNLQAAFAIML